MRDAPIGPGGQLQFGGLSCFSPWRARAFGNKTCRDGNAALLVQAVELFRYLAVVRGRHFKLLYNLDHVDLLIVDPWADTRHRARSTTQVASAGRTMMGTLRLNKETLG